jgi:hypothetical protein
VVAVVVLASAACGGGSERTATNAPLISDAVHGGGSPGFYFLPPLVDPTPLPAVFDGTRSLVAELVAPDGSVMRSVPLQVDTTERNYRAHIDTDGLALESAETYRVRVIMGARELGFADVLVFASQREAKSLSSDEYIELVDGKKLPVKVYLGDIAPPVLEVRVPSDHGCTSPEGLSMTNHDGVAEIVANDESPLTVTCTLSQGGQPLVAASSCPEGFAFSGLRSGRYQLQVAASDGTHVTAAAVHWIVDEVPPLIMNVRPLEGETLLFPNGPTTGRFGVMTDYWELPPTGFGIVTSVSIEGIAVTTQFTDRSGDWWSGQAFFDYPLPEDMSPGGYDVDIFAQDCVGNVSRQSVLFYVEQAP